MVAGSIPTSSKYFFLFTFSKMCYIVHMKIEQKQKIFSVQNENNTQCSLLILHQSTLVIYIHQNKFTDLQQCISLPEFQDWYNCIFTARFDHAVLFLGAHHKSRDQDFDDRHGEWSFRTGNQASHLSHYQLHIIGVFL